MASSSSASSTRSLRPSRCPTCARTNFDVEKYAKIIEKKFSSLPVNKKIAVMGCVVNGPGESKDADIAFIGGKNILLYKKGKFSKKISKNNILDILEKELKDNIK